MKFAVIYHTQNEVAKKRVHKAIEAYSNFIHPFDGLWLIDCDGDPLGISAYLADAVGSSGSLLVFELNDEWATIKANSVKNWLNEG